MKRILFVALFFPLLSFAGTYYVNGTSGSDSNSGTSSSAAKKTIQSAVTAASSGSTIIVAAGTYQENVNWTDKRLELKTAGVLDVTINGNQNGSCIKVGGSSSGTIIDGFIVYNGAPTNSGNKYGGGICCDTSATIKNCIFKNNGNSSQHFSGGLQIGGDSVLVYNCLFYGNVCYACGGAAMCEGNGTFDRCTVYGNTCSSWNKIGGIAVASDGSATIKNSILWGNNTLEVGRFSGQGRSDVTYAVSYSCVDGGFSGTGNISSNPGFTETTSLFGLSSTSPCINAGNPSDTDPDGTRADMGFSVSRISRSTPSIPATPSLSATHAALDLTSAYEIAGDGSTTWTVDSGTYYYGGSSLKSAPISHSGITFTTLTVNGSGTVSFYWKVSSESGYDKLHCYLDGVEAVTAISGTPDWAPVTLTLSDEGEHVIKWSYTKDGSVNSNSDCGWIDRVVVSVSDGSVIEGAFTCTQYNMNSSVSSLSYAKSYLEDSSKWIGTPVTKKYNVISFFDQGESTTSYTRVPFPGNATTDDGQENFVMVATARIVIPSAGYWSFSCWSDDGFELTLKRGDATYTSSYSSTRSHDYTTKSFDLAAGEYELKLVYFDCTEGATCMLYAAQGSYSSFNSSAFKLLGESGCPIGFASATSTDSYLVSFDPNGGVGSIANERFDCGERKALSNNEFVRSGYTFQGWAVSDNGSVVYQDGASVCDLTEAGNTLTLFAVWSANTYPVSLSDTSTTLNVTYGSPLPSITPPTRAGYRFAGYYSAENGAGVQYYMSSGVSARNWDIAASATLYPYWVVNAYVVRFEANGGSGSMSNQSFGITEAKNLTANAFTRNGYQFSGWATSRTGDVRYADCARVSNLAAIDGATVTLYAQWRGNTYQVSLSPLLQGLNVTYYDLTSAVDGSTWQAHVDTYAEAASYGSSLSSTIVTNTLDLGSTLDFGNGYSTSARSNFHGKYGAYGTDYFTVKVDGFYHAETTGSYTFKISHDDHCVVYIDQQEAYHYWSSMGSSSWNTFTVSLEAGYHEILIWFFEYGGYQWLRFQGIDQNKLYRSDPSVSTDQSIDVVFGEPMPPIPVPSREGYTFAGYFTGMNGTGVQYYGASGSSVRNWDQTGQVALYPHWVLNGYSVSFDANGGTGSMTEQFFSVGETRSLTINAFERRGYTFAGWSKTASGDVVYANGARVSNLSYADGDIVTLYAVWTRNVYECVLPGFVASTFTGSTSLNTSSDIWNNSSAYVEEASGLYATSLSSTTTKAYGTHMYMERGVTYNFKGCYDDWVGVCVDGSWILRNTTECREATGSYTPTYSGWHKVEFRVANNGGVGGCQNSSEYGIKWNSTKDTTWRNVEAGNSWPRFSVAPPIVVSDSAEGATPVVCVNGTAYIHYAKAEGATGCLLKIDDVDYMSSDAEYGVGVWQPHDVGPHTITWVSGGLTATMMVDVGTLAFPMISDPNPPTAADNNITLGSGAKNVVAAGGTVSITTSGSGTWSASVSADWITINGASSKNAGLSCIVRVAANTGAESRTGYVYVSGHVFTITQDGVGLELAEYSAEHESQGGSGEILVLADGQTSWSVRPENDWISVSETTGMGESYVHYAVAPYAVVTDRTGYITVGGRSFEVHQVGSLLEISREHDDIDYLSHAIEIDVSAFRDTEWFVTPMASWVSVVTPTTGYQTGSGKVLLAVNENPSYIARSCYVTIGTERYDIVQDGRPTEALAFSISPERATASVNGANGLLAVSATPDLPWTAESQANWLTVMPTFREGTGDGNVVYTATPNSTMSERSGTIRVVSDSGSGMGVRLHTVTQPAATAAISVSSHSFAAEGDYYEVEVTTGDNVNWTVLKGAGWITIDGENAATTSRIGPGRVRVAVSENHEVDPRTATITIAGHSFGVMQRGRMVEVEYISYVFDADGGDGTVDVHPNGTVNWTAVSSAPWLAIWAEDGATDNPDGSVSGSSDGTIGYYVDPYVGDGESLTATITIGDKVVYITQRAYDANVSPSAATVSGVAGAGEFAFSASIDDVWNALDILCSKDWIETAQVTSFNAATKSGTIRYTYKANDSGVPRTGTIVVAGESYQLTQEARRLARISVEVDGQGATTGAGAYDVGNRVVLAATPRDGYEFLGWYLNGSCVATSLTMAFTASVDKSYSAHFGIIPTYVVNGEVVRRDTVIHCMAPADQIDAQGSTKLVCRGTSAYPEKGTSFSLVASEDVSFDWDLWATNYLVTVDGVSSWHAAGSIVELSPRVPSGQTFFRWTGDVSREDAGATSLKMLIDGPKSLSSISGVARPSLATALDAAGLVFRTGGDSAWFGAVDALAKSGYTAACAALSPCSEAWVETTIVGSGTLSFDWRTVCEHDDSGRCEWDRLAIFVNGVEVSRIDGATDYQRISLPIVGNETVVRWSFYRDEYDEPDSPARVTAWIDGVTFE